VQVAFSFGQFHTDPQTENGPGSSVIKGNVTYINATYIISTLTFYGAIYLNNSILNCDNDITTYIIDPSRLLSE